MLAPAQLVACALNAQPRVQRASRPGAARPKRPIRCSQEASAESAVTPAESASRRTLLLGAAAVLPALLLHKSATAAEPLNVVITGANSGIGFDAAGKLAAAGHNVTLVRATRPLVGARPCLAHRCARPRGSLAGLPDAAKGPGRRGGDTG